MDNHAYFMRHWELPAPSMGHVREFSLHRALLFKFRDSNPFTRHLRPGKSTTAPWILFHYRSFVPENDLPFFCPVFPGFPPQVTFDLFLTLLFNAPFRSVSLRHATSVGFSPLPFF